MLEKFTPGQYLKMDVASAYGLDKNTWTERLDWFEEFEPVLESKEAQAEEPLLYRKAVLAVRAVQRGEATGHVVNIDVTNSGPQLMGVMAGCRKTCEATNAIDTGVRSDLYMAIVRGFVLKPDRDLVKEAVMTGLYESGAVPERVFGSDVRLFWEAMDKQVPGAMRVLHLTSGTWQPNALNHKWTMPDGFEVDIPVLQTKDVRMEIAEIKEALGGCSYTHRVTLNKGKPKGKAMSANIIHSVDALVIRELVRRTNYPVALVEAKLAYLKGLPKSYARPKTMVTFNQVLELVGVPKPAVVGRMIRLCKQVLSSPPFEMLLIHDCLRVSPVNVQRARECYRDVIVDLHQGNVLRDIVSEVTGEPCDFMPAEDLTKELQGMNYAIC